MKPNCLDISTNTQLERLENIRVKNIPSNFDEQMLKKEIWTLFRAMPVIHSLEPYTLTQKCATVTFPNEAQNFPSVILEAPQSYRRPPPGTYELAYDTKFIGVTPLYDAGDMAEVEYVTSFTNFFFLDLEVIARY
jgi:hypothetical protein